MVKCCSVVIEDASFLIFDCIILRTVVFSRCMFRGLRVIIIWFISIDDTNIGFNINWCRYRLSGYVRDRRYFDWILHSLCCVIYYFYIFKEILSVIYFCAIFREEMEFQFFLLVVAVTIVPFVAFKFMSLELVMVVGSLIGVKDHSAVVINLIFAPFIGEWVGLDPVSSIYYRCGSSSWSYVLDIMDLVVYSVSSRISFGVSCIFWYMICK